MTKLVSIFFLKTNIGHTLSYLFKTHRFFDTKVNISVIVILIIKF